MLTTKRKCQIMVIFRHLGSYKGCYFHKELVENNSNLSTNVFLLKKYMYSTNRYLYITIIHVIVLEFLISFQSRVPKTCSKYIYIYIYRFH